MTAMIYVMIMGVVALTSILAWYVQTAMRSGLQRYHHAFTIQARQGLGEMFLFLAPGQVWVASMLLCVACAVGIYVVSGSLIFAGLVATVMLFAPPYALSFVRQCRIRKLEQQLPDLLLGLAGALRAGSGIQSALRHGADQAVPP